MTAQARNGPDRDDRYRDLTDPELMLQIRDGDAGALGALLERYWRPLVRYAARLVHSVDTAEDLVQEAFVTVWTRRASWKPVGTPQAYLYRIVRNGALLELRRRETRTRHEPELRRRSPPAPTPLDSAAGAELETAIEAALAALPDRRREAFVLIRYHALSLGEVAEIMEISTQTVANHVSMAVAELRKALERFLT